PWRGCRVDLHRTSHGTSTIRRAFQVRHRIELGDLFCRRLNGDVEDLALYRGLVFLASAIRTFLGPSGRRDGPLHTPRLQTRTRSSRSTRMVSHNWPLAGTNPIASFTQACSNCA